MQCTDTACTDATTEYVINYLDFEANYPSYINRMSLPAETYETILSRAIDAEENGKVYVALACPITIDPNSIQGVS